MTDSLFGSPLVVDGHRRRDARYQWEQGQQRLRLVSDGMLLGPTTLLAALVVYAVALCRRSGPSLRIIDVRGNVVTENGNTPCDAPRGPYRPATAPNPEALTKYPVLYWSRS